MKKRLHNTLTCGIALLAAAASVHGTTDLATAPLVTSSTSSVLPNLLFILDDSGSMDWEYLPDWANDTDPFSSTAYTSIAGLNRNNGFNGVAYNPAVTYSPPVAYNADGTLDTTTYPSQTSANTSVWTAVKSDGYGIQSTSTSNITSSAYYYTFLPGEYCDNPNLRTCTTASSASTSYPYPATLRWCNSSALTTCQAVWISGSYTYPRYPKQATTTITISGTSSTSVSSIRVNNQEILSATTAASTSATTLATDIVAKINACLPAVTGSCQVAGYSAYNSSGTVTINAPVTAGNITHTPVVTKSGSMTATPAAFSGYSAPGVNFRRNIVSTNDSYPYPGLTTKASTRTDCAGSTCTYAEEMTNFANWWAYYRSRMQMMKTATSNAFSSIGTSYRVGYMSINNNTGSDFLNIGQFDITQKRAWYAKLFAANPSNSTPLREALAKAGRLYAGKLNGTTFNGSTVTDPLQYSCQQSFTLLSTDGYWNGNAGYKVDGSTAVGNQDGLEPRPFSDGATVTYSRSTSQLQSSQTQQLESTNQVQSHTEQLQSSTSTLQSTTGTLQQRTASLQWRTKQQATTAALRRATNLQQTTAALRWATNLQKTTAPLRWATNLQTKTGALKWATNLKKQTGTLSWATNLRKTTGILQMKPGSTWIDVTTPGNYACTSSTCRIKSGSPSTAYISTYPPTCAVTYNVSGTTAVGADGRVISACATSSYNTAVAVGAGNSCNGALANVQCSAGGTATYVSTYPPTCTDTFNASGTSTADASGNVTDCTTSTYNTAANVGASGSCNGALANVQCSMAGTFAYVSSYPPTCTDTFDSSGESTANASGNVTECTTAGSYNTAAAVGAGGSCNAALSNVQCSTGTTSTAYISTYPPTCASTYSSGGASTADASGNVVTACTTAGSYGTATSVGAGGACNGSLSNVQCSTGTASSSYVTSYPPTCSVTYNSGGANTADGSGNVVTACPTAAYSTATAVGAGGACDGSLANVQCSVGTTSSAYVSTYPPTCAVNYGSGGANVADASGNVVTACATSGSWSGWSNTAGGGTCTTSSAVDCQYNWSSWSNASACTTNYSSTSPYSVTSGTDCQYSWGTATNVGSCTSIPADTGPNYTTATARNCAYSAWSSWANASSCTAAAQSASSPYSVGTAVQCRTWYNNSSATDTGWVPASSCTPTSGSGQQITCQTIATGPTPVASCSCGTAPCTTAATAGNSWTQTSCTTNVITPATGVASCTSDAPTALNSYVASNCTTVTTGPTSTSTCTAASAASSNNYTTTTCSVSSTSGGTSNTLADVAEYYYATDLRTSTLGNCTGAVVAPATTGNDVCTNDVPTSGQDGASWQHMTTFTLGLGANGYMQFSPSYASATSGDYYDVKNGTLANPSGGICSWQSSGTVCNWPTPSSDSQANIDDLWHAAVNGRGTYFSATSPSTLSVGLSSALAGVSARLGSSAAATTSNPNVTSGDNFVFSSTFTTQDWTGQLYRQQIDLTTGVVPDFDVNNSSTYDWAAQSQLDGNTERTIYTFDSSPSAPANKLKIFAWDNLTSAEQNYFQGTNIASMSQFCSAGVTCLSSSDQTSASGANLVAFLAGDRTNEGVSTDTTKYYRQRAHVLGDIVNAEAVYVKGPLFTYGDTNYTDFISANSSRQSMVYAASNDGMLHAFNAATGAETWAYVPAMVLPNLYKLADKNYSAQHRYFADGTPVVGDICPNAPASTCSSSQWKTILVAGLNGGGRGFYALDITVPAAPKLLWEYTDTNMGYTYGNPIIAKLADGTWAVLVTSGYNNVTPGDGVGRLYVLNANTGALIRSISTGVGDTTTPSGLARINAWVDSAMSDNTALRVYGGDLLGNLWRFDINDNVGASGYEAERLVTLYSNAAGTVAQPITSKPEIGDVSGYAVVFVGTGRYLGTSDLTDTSLQSFYAVKDRLATPAVTAYFNPRASGSGFINQTETNTTCPSGTPTTICTTGQSVRISSSNAVNFASDSGWYLDLPDSGERANTDPTLALGTLGFTTNVPNVSACTAGGYSYRYFLDYRTGAAVSTSTTRVVAVKLGNALATRGVFVRLPNNTVVQLTRLSSGTTVTSNVPIGSGGGTTRRVSWRELAGQ